MNTEHVIKKMGQDRVHQIISSTPTCSIVIGDFGGGLLVTLGDHDFRPSQKPAFA